ncbi:MAG: helix-turn-helix transcriptional regulator [Candidatus Omnitrophota bacterium]|nr:helix-turn-helix transcriptional regulator [Candidatus Omnitrophota bacterium]
MEDNTVIFWDKKIRIEEARGILRDELNPRFIEFSSLLLARTNKPKEVFNNYLNREVFARNWSKIKLRMRENKWNDTRIIFWDEIYRAVKKNLNIKGFTEIKERPLRVDSEIKIICDQIKEVRQKSGLTQVELAKKAGLSQQSISFVEQGYVNISLRTLKKIADALNLKIILKAPTDYL